MGKSGKRKKLPRLGAATPIGGKRPAVASDPSTDARGFVSYRFSLADLEDGSVWGWRSLDPAKFAVVHEKLCHYERLSFNELERMAGNKPIPTEHLSPKAQKRLKDLQLDDLDVLWELRLSGTERIWGKRDGSVFYPLWWDPTHTVCPSALRNT